MVESGGNGNPPKKSDPKEEKVRATRERQAEERLRRLEELKKHALEAQNIREQKEADRRRRMDELRLKENERRALVETRKKEIWEAERERRESILRKNMERDARMDAKRRNERSSIVFAFGSSTPRLLETADSAVSTYWGPRRATSTANLRLFPANPAMTESVTDGPSGANPRRPSEREQEPKKRAVSAGGLYRSPSDKMSTSMYEVFHWEPQSSVVPTHADAEDNWNVPRVGRRKTDLVPTTPSPRDPTSRPGSGTRSLARTPGRAVSMARLDQLARPKLSHSTVQLEEPQPLRAAKSMVALGRPAPVIAPRMTRAERLRQRARAVAASRSTASEGQPSHPSSAPRMTRAERLRQRARAVAASRSTASEGQPSHPSSGDVTPSRPGSVMSQSSILSTSLSRPRTTPRRPRPSSIHVTGVSKDKLQSPSDDKPKFKEMKINKPPPPKPPVSKKQIQQKNEEIKKSQQKGQDDNKKIVENNIVAESNRNSVEKEKLVAETNILQVNGMTEKQEVERKEKVLPPTEPSELVQIETCLQNNGSASSGEIKEAEDSGVSLLVDFSSPMPPVVPVAVEIASIPVPVDGPSEPLPPTVAAVVPNEVLVPIPAAVAPTAPPPVVVSDVSCQGHGAEVDALVKAPKPLAITEEEARAKLAERRRLAREQAEREAEAERQRIAKEEAEEAERVRKEEEEQRKAEEEQLRLIEEARRVEEQRLMLAIQEAQKREEEEKERKRQEELARLEKEEAERLAREELEKQRLEMAERLKKEEEERQARRKRVEAIMKRTRNVAPNNSATKAECEKGEQDGAEREKDDSKGNLEAFLHGERLSADRSLTNGQAVPNQNIPTKMESSHSNGISSSGIANEDCVNSNSSLVTPLIAFQGSKETPLPTDFMA